MAHLVYLRNFCERPCPEVWQELFYGVDGALKQRAVATFELKPEEAALPIAVLKLRYPLPVEAAPIEAA